MGTSYPLLYITCSTQHTSCTPTKTQKHIIPQRLTLLLYNSVVYTCTRYGGLVFQRLNFCIKHSKVYYYLTYIISRKQCIRCTTHLHGVYYNILFIKFYFDFCFHVNGSYLVKQERCTRVYCYMLVCTKNPIPRYTYLLHVYRVYVHMYLLHSYQAQVCIVT